MGSLIYRLRRYIIKRQVTLYNRWLCFRKGHIILHNGVVEVVTPRSLFTMPEYQELDCLRCHRTFIAEDGKLMRKVRVQRFQLELRD